MSLHDNFLLLQARIIKGYTIKTWFGHLICKLKGHSFKVAYPEIVYCERCGENV